MLPSTFEQDASASLRQHYSCTLIGDSVVIDAGSLASAASAHERLSVRDIVLSHAHLDHIAGLPLFIDDLFPTLKEPLRIHAAHEVIDVLETHIFNWKVYPRFSELENDFGRVIEYVTIEADKTFRLGDLRFTPISVDHGVPSMGFVVRDEHSTIAITGDTAEMEGFWDRVNLFGRLDALLIECAFPNEFDELASKSHHFTPAKLGLELKKFRNAETPIFVTNIKPTHRESVIEQLRQLPIEGLDILEIGRTYDF